MVAALALAAVSAGWVAPTRPAVGLLPDPYAQSDVRRPQPPSASHPLGTDSLGRDMLSRTLHGARLSLSVAVSAIAIAMLIGGAAGLSAGYFGGWVDAAVMRAVDVLLAFPGLLLAIAVLAALGEGLGNLVVAVALLNIGPFARQLRAAALEVRSREYLEAARALGAGHARLLVRHVLPNVAGPAAVLATLGVGLAILEAAGLSFLGLGVEPDTPEWGRMLADSRAFLTTEPWVAVAPGVSITLTVLGFNLFGDALRDRLDPRTRG
jgi:peptide/nickel transport system permease protein